MTRVGRWVERIGGFLLAALGVVVLSYLLAWLLLGVILLVHWTMFP